MYTIRPIHSIILLLSILSIWATNTDGQRKNPDPIITITRQVLLHQIPDLTGQDSYFDTISNLWVVRSWNLLSADTLNISGLLPHEGTPYMIDCCTETTGWYDTIAGLKILVPTGFSAKDTLEISFAADLIELSSTPECYISQEHIKNSFRFSRTTELRLKGSQVYYSYGTIRSTGRWIRYTSPLLINRSGILWLVNKELRKGPSRPVAVKLIRIHDFEGIKSNPLPVSPKTTDQLFYLNDRDTALTPDDSNRWVTWNSGKIELLFNPGMSRTLRSMSIGFIQQSAAKSALPKKIEIWGASHSGQWERITTKRVRKKTNQFCQRVPFSFSRTQKEYRFYKLIFITRDSPLTIDEIGFDFAGEE